MIMQFCRSSAGRTQTSAKNFRAPTAMWARNSQAIHRSIVAIQLNFFELYLYAH